MTETKTKETNTQNKEYLTQKEHAARLGVSRQTISINQKKYNLYKTVTVGRYLGYLWIDGEPQYNDQDQKEETSNDNN